MQGIDSYPLSADELTARDVLDVHIANMERANDVLYALATSSVNNEIERAQLDAAVLKWTAARNDARTRVARLGIEYANRDHMVDTDAPPPAQREPTVAERRRSEENERLREAGARILARRAPPAVPPYHPGAYDCRAAYELAVQLAGTTKAALVELDQRLQAVENAPRQPLDARARTSV